ncbi:alpha/beta hydrolase [Variovorax sp.]|uniref:alpha/beta fold hydrolase n=1 Tax=Variovorax sp. TaxID=1871043 RepID=UPI002D487D4D|nr:alpha/beta hydrolase [Variovorax sp.]HYP83706.1 alpha/beta hydrolase [Variovorax sp.]
MNLAPAMDVPAAELDRLQSRFAARRVLLDDGAVVSVRECGTAGGQGGEVFVCLHGIGSGAASWLETALLLAQAGDRVIAWDMPGYGASTPVAAARPVAADYALRLHGLLEALDIGRCVLVGHSLGAITAAHAARAGAPAAGRIARLVLLSPAIGYGAAGKEEQAERVRTQRLDTLARDGVAGMAAKADQRLLSAHAGELARQWVRWNMGRLDPAGYSQAVQLLAGAVVLADLPPAMPVQVACGALDVVTTPDACAQVAHACGVPLQLLPEAGHACYVEQPQATARLLRAAT